MDAPDRTGSRPRADLDHRGLGQHIARHDQCALSRCAADCCQHRASRVFMTPVMWPVQVLGPNAWWAQLNPFFAAIDVLRGPLLGQPTSRYSWAILLIITAFGCAASFAFFARFRSRIAFWV